MIPMPLRDAHGMQLPAQFDPDGKPYYMLDNGQKQYISPQEAVGLKTSGGGQVDPRIDKFLASTPQPSSQNGFASKSSWDPTTGTIKKSMNGGGLGGLILGGAAVAAPLVIPALLGAAGGAGAAGAAPAFVGPTAASGGAAATTGAAATGSVLASTPAVGSGLIGAVPGAGMVSGIGGGGSTMLGGFLKNLIPSGGDILKGVGGYLQGRSQAKSEQQQRADTLMMNQQRREDEMRTQIANFLQGQSAQRLAATQMDPYAQQKSLNGANVRRSFAQGWNPATGFNGSFDMSALDPSTLGKANTDFQGVANDTGTQQKILDYLSQNGGPNTKVCYDPKGQTIPCAAQGVPGGRV